MRSLLNLTSPAFAAALLLAATAHAQSICDKGPFEERLTDRYAHPTCRNENPETEKRASAIEGAFKKKDENSASLIVRVREQLAQLIEQVDRRHPPEKSTRYSELLKQHLREAFTRISALPDLDALARERAGNRALQIDFWKPAVRRAPVIQRSDMPADLAAKVLVDADPKCLEDTGKVQACTRAFEQAIYIGDDVYVATALMEQLHAPQGKKFHELAELREKRWGAYLYDTQFQYWWELGLNRYLEENCPPIHKQIVALIDKECVKQSRDAFDNPLGFRDPPESRAIFLHPDVGVQYVDAEARGDRLKPALVIQWFGYQWWKWNGAKVSSLRGLSFVSTLSDNAATKPLGWGAQVQIDQYAVAFTSHDGKLAITLNLQLGDKMSKLNEEWANKLKRLED